MKMFSHSLFCLLIVANEARVFQLCELFYFLRSLGLDNYKRIPLKHYVCVALFSSKMNTEYYELAGGIPYYGIFRLKGSQSCKNKRHKSVNKCNIDCDKFLDDDIRDDVACMKKLVTQRDGLDPWPHHKKYCDTFVLNYIFIRCTFFFQRDEWFYTLTKSRIPHPLHIQDDTDMFVILPKME